MSEQHVKWRNVSREGLHTIDEQAWPAQPHGLALPNEVLREASSVSDLAAFFAIGEAWAQLVARYLPQSAPRVLDLGCGCGKLARFLYLVPDLTYVGIDIFLPSIRWCEKAFKPVAHRFRFVHFDGHSAIYNPTGIMKARDYVLPLHSGEIDVAVCASLFTHLLQEDALHYLRELHRVAKPGGKVLVSIHTSPTPGSQFSGDETRIDINEEYFLRMAESAGLVLLEKVGVVYGQTTFLLGKPRF